jgi:hypothetical protein
MKLLIAMLISCAAMAQTWVEQRTFVSSGVVTPRIDGLVTESFSGKLGAFAWFQTQKGYSEGYGGITYSPKPWIQLAGGAGIEENVSPARVGGFVWAGGGKISLLFIPEYGGSGFWWKAEVNRKVNKSVGVGLITERYKGTGLRVEYKIPRTPLLLWGAPMFEKSRVNAAFAIRWVIK